MDKDGFLEMCKKVSFLPEREYGIKSAPPDLCVKYKGLTFYPVGYKVTFGENGKPIHTAILHDLKVNSFLECELSKIERVSHQ